MKTILTITLMLLLMSCSKSNRNNLSDCDQQMIEKYKDQIDCTNYPQIYTILQRGIYNMETIYFTAIICPACDVVPPQKGSRCDGSEVEIKVFSDVKDIQTVKGCSEK